MSEETKEVVKTTEEIRAETKKGIRAIIGFAKPFKKQFTVLLFLGLLSAIANGSVPYITGRFFDALIGLSEHKPAAAGGAFGSLPLWGLLLTAWAVVQIVANNTDWIMDRIRRHVSNGLHLNIQAQGFIHLFRLPLSYHKNRHVNGEIQKLSTAGWRVTSIMQNIISIVPQFVSVLIGITLAASINRTLAGVLLLGVLLYVLLLVRILSPAAKMDSAAHRSWIESWDDAYSAALQIESVKNASAEAYEAEKVRAELLGKTARLWYKLEMIWSNISFFQRMIVLLTQLTVFILSVQFVANDTLTIGDLVALNGYAMMFFGPFVSLGYSWQTIQNGVSAAAHADEIFKEPTEVYAPEDAVALGHITGKVSFDRVSFRYGAEQPMVLHDINFERGPARSWRSSGNPASEKARRSRSSPVITSPPRARY